jgi:hypothetical protein
MNGSFASNGEAGLLMKVNASGAPTWGWVLEGFQTERILDLEVLADGGILAVGRGEKDATGPEDPQDLVILRKSGGVDPPAVLARVLSRGRIRAARIVAGAAGAVYVAVSVQGLPPYLTGAPEVPPETTETAQLFLVRFDPIDSQAPALRASWAQALGTLRTPDALAMQREGRRVVTAADVGLAGWPMLAAAAGNTFGTVLFSHAEDGSLQYAVLVNGGEAAEVRVLLGQPGGGVIVAGGYSGRFGTLAGNYGPAPSASPPERGGPDEIAEAWDMFVLRLAIP